MSFFDHMKRVNTSRKNHSEHGQGVVEYALILVLIAVVVIVIVSLLGPALLAGGTNERMAEKIQAQYPEAIRVEIINQIGAVSPITLEAKITTEQESFVVTAECKYVGLDSSNAICKVFDAHSGSRGD